MKNIILIAVFLLSLSSAYAVTPEGGMWAIDIENNGKPGRGFEIDIQGSTLVLTYYGYRSDGKAQWYLAAGSISNNHFTGSLEQFEGGTALGMPPVSALGTGGVGTVTMEFSSATQGTITLPGEGSKAISRLNFARPADPNSLNGAYQLVRTVAVLMPSGIVLDSATNVTATGTFILNGSYFRQTMNLTYAGKSSAVQMEGTFTDYGSYHHGITTQGAVGDPRVIKRGDDLITFTVSSGASEVDYWHRVSADPLKVPVAQVQQKSALDAQTINAPAGGLAGAILNISR